VKAVRVSGADSTVKVVLVSVQIDTDQLTEVSVFRNLVYITYSYWCWIASTEKVEAVICKTIHSYIYHSME